MNSSELLAIPKLGPVIAIDGPAGTGKSSATKRLAERLGFIHVDTGALYRSIAFLLLRERGGIDEHGSPVDGFEGFGKGLTPADEARAAAIAVGTRLEFRRRPDKNPSNRVYVNDKDITAFIRTLEVSIAASRVSAVAEVRSALLGLQRTMGGQGKAILEGRDIGTIIFPDADVKFYLTASIEERAKRRLAEIEASGSDAPSFEEVKNQIATRDEGDMSRKVAPLKRAPDAVALDTSAMTLDEVVDWMEKKVQGKLGLK